MAKHDLLRCVHISKAQIPPTFLAPTLLALNHPRRSPFSTTPSPSYPRRDLSKNRNVSAIHRSGIPKRWKLAVTKEELPRPILDPEKHMKFPVNKDHGLWQFFNEKRTAMNTPEEDHAHGRSWTVEELRQKSWDDLHALWWVCLKDMNRTMTSKQEWSRIKAGYGEYEADERMKTVRQTQKGIKTVLVERWYAWEDARRLWDIKEWDGFKDGSFPPNATVEPQLEKIQGKAG